MRYLRGLGMSCERVLRYTFIWKRLHKTHPEKDRGKGECCNLLLILVPKLIQRTLIEKKKYLSNHNKVTDWVSKLQFPWLL